MKSSYILGAFSVICFIFAMIFSADVSDVQSKRLSGNGGDFGPLVVKEKNSVYEIVIKNYVAVNDWSEIEVEMLDAKKQRLFSFGDGMWHESGYDDEGAWTESKTDYSMDITIEKPGDYYFIIRSEGSNLSAGNITFSVVQQRGSNVLFLTLGFVAMFAALLAFYLDQNITFNDKTHKTRLLILVIVLIVFFLSALIYSSRGWGYMGHSGYRSGPSFFYFGGPRIYNQPSNRDGSISGSGQRGGGFSGGK